MSTLTNHASNNNNNNHNIINNNSSGNSSIQQHHPHHQLSPQGASPTSTTGVGSPSSASSCSNSSIINNNHHQYHHHQQQQQQHAADSFSNIINNNSTSQSHPTTTTTSTTASGGSSSSGGVVGGILGVREVSAKLFLPFARSKMMHSSSSSVTAAAAHSTDPASSGTPDPATMATTAMAAGAAANTSFSAAGAAAAGGGAGGASSGTGRGSSLVIPESLNVVLHGYQRKLKTNKKKYFVVYGDRPDKFARLEYFDSEKKFKQSFTKNGAGCEGPVAKRSILLRSCFNINKRHDTKKHIIALFTKDDNFCIVFESEDELNRWLRTLLRLQRGEESEGDPPRPTFEHVWDVYVQRKGLGDSYGILGTYRLCITDKILSLVRIGSELTPSHEKRADVVEFSLASIRRCGHSQRYFYLEVGRSSKTGAGEIWMEVQDSIIAQNMYTTIMKSAKSKDDNLGPMIRIRSSSANAASKPTSMLFRRQTHTGQKPINCSPSSEDQSNNAQNSESSSSAASINTVVLVGSPPKGSGAPNSSGVAIARERCDSLPSRNRTTSETMPHQQQQHLQQQQQQQSQQHHQLMLNSGGMPPPRMIPSNNRPHSVHISHSHSPPVNSSPLSPPPLPATYSTGSDGSSLSIDESTDSFITGSLTPDEGNGYPKVINQLNSGCSIPEENSEEFIKDYGHIDLRAGCGLSQHDDYGVQNHHSATTVATNTNTSVGTTGIGSSSGRFGHHHHNSLSLPISQASRRGGSPAPPSTVGSVEGSAYMEMCSPSGSSPGDPSGSCYMAMSPVADFSRGLCSSSSAHSRASSLAEDLVDGYVPMSMPRAVCPPPEEYMLMDPTLNGGASGRLSNATSTGGGTSNHGAGGCIGGGMSSAASSCSITSGTPSTDLRLSLEKVPAYIGQSDDHEVNDRPFRTYSVGSRPELIKRKLRVDMLSSGESSAGGSGGSASSRQRAFSVGSRAKVPRCSDVYKGYSAAPVIVSFASTSSQGSMLESSNNNSSSSTSSISHAGSFGASIGDSLPLDELGGGTMGKKSGSGSLLLSDGNGKPPAHGSHGRMSDLMEIDYSSPRQVKAGARSSEPAGMEDYLDMSGNNNDESDRRTAAQSVAGYVEMRPGRLHSQSEENDYLNMTPGGSRDEPDCPVPVAPGTSSKSISSPIQIGMPKPPHSGGPEGGAAAGSGSSAGQNNNYLEMYPRALAKDTNRGSASAATKVPSEDYLNMAPLMISSLGEASGSEEKMSAHHHHGDDESLESSSAPDGYMEMSWSHGVVTTGGTTVAAAPSSTADRSVPPNGEDYMNMSFGSQAEDASRAFSAPITIQPGAGKCRLDLSGESKVEAGANIPNYLPLGQHPDARKSVHHHPHAAPATIVALQQHLPLTAQAPIQTTTGQQSGSVGFTPSKPAAETPERSRCDSRDSGIATPSGGSQPTIFPFSPASPTKPFASGQDVTMVEPLEDLSQNYAELSLGRQQQQQQQQLESATIARKLSTSSRGSFGKLQTTAASASFNQPDYVNYCPTTPPVEGASLPLNVQPSRSRIEDDGAGDYALMNPAASSRKHSTTSMGAQHSGPQPNMAASCSSISSSFASTTASASVSPPMLVARKSTLLSSQQMGFKPIASSQDAELLLLGRVPAGPTANSPKALNLNRRTGEPAFGFGVGEHQLPPLQRSISTGTARPNSVNSELIGGAKTPGPTMMLPAGHGGQAVPAAGTTRPSSANSERLPIISATSSSASSTSTLCESKNQSPSASSTALATAPHTTSSPGVPGSRPDSVSSITDPNIVSRPPSVSSERELHYASLDLPPCSKQPFAPGTMMALLGAAAATGTITTASATASGTTISTTPGSSGVTKMEVDEPLPGSNESRSSVDSMNSSSPSPSSSGCSLHQQTQQPQQPQQQPVRCAAFTYAQIDFVRSQAPKQHQPPSGPGPAGSTGSGGTSTPQSSQA